MVLLFWASTIPGIFVRSWNHFLPWALDPLHISPHCAHISPISGEIFLARQKALAEELHALNAGAYITEPGASAAYFANISTSHWHLSERPLLLIVSPVVDTEGQVQANVSILTPLFESTRAKLLPIPSEHGLSFPEWAEDRDPFATAVSSIINLGSRPIFVDDSVRLFVAEGLQRAAPASLVASAPVEVKRLRERKSKEEIEILKCANEVSHTIFNPRRL